MHWIQCDCDKSKKTKEIIHTCDIDLNQLIQLLDIGESYVGVIYLY